MQGRFVLSVLDPMINCCSVHECWEAPGGQLDAIPAVGQKHNPDGKACAVKSHPGPFLADLAPPQQTQPMLQNLLWKFEVDHHDPANVRV